MIRSKLILAVVLLSGLLGSCKKDKSANSNTTGSTTYNPDPVEVTGCAIQTGISKVVCLSDAFKATLTSSQVATLQTAYSSANAKKWSNLPQALVQSSNKRVGLNFGSMTTTQIQYAKALIKAVAGAGADEGWDEQQQLLNADEYLGANGGSSEYGAANYYIALLGTPATTGTFEIMFGGHHDAFANTYKDGVLVGATPSFRGVEPFGTFTWNSKSNQPLQAEQAAFSAMLNGLTTAQLATAKLNATFSDILVGPQKDAAFPSTPSGIACSSLSASQKALVMAAIATYVGDVADAAPITAKYSNELDNTYISYSGTTGLVTQNDYVRIDGPSVWIEYNCQHGVILSGNHPHSVWRDKKTDYGSN
ncbi:DUF3500 domain-containing protein [Hufsiella ginkgonis]|uniref:DUF3500 domain-containing protein n=1 Tax=Hufsiella ginkgonis TaxID=2695274 RepID=A0A7K1XYK2_9SPHI|nr:DUF3500 domain-containing protein [Hufsiella ginkgonis]MXV15819.1 DUF3500 domain-containing protein [Hufsiella ginkgonis]